ncbi:hypothetical protein C8Q74DRAFT_1219417 [Fomes fomentarius]|nr:hypothetical protein C8Q74DRAFT_1219417 [Fomes fomentarius]
MTATHRRRRGAGPGPLSSAREVAKVGTRARGGSERIGSSSPWRRRDRDRDDGAEEERPEEETRIKEGQEEYTDLCMAAADIAGNRRKKRGIIGPLANAAFEHVQPRTLPVFEHTLLPKHVLCRRSSNLLTLKGDPSKAQSTDPHSIATGNRLSLETHNLWLEYVLDIAQRLPSPCSPTRYPFPCCSSWSAAQARCRCSTTHCRCTARVEEEAVEEGKVALGRRSQIVMLLDVFTRLDVRSCVVLYYEWKCSNWLLHGGDRRDHIPSDHAQLSQARRPSAGVMIPFELLHSIIVTDCGSDQQLILSSPVQFDFLRPQLDVNPQAQANLADNQLESAPIPSLSPQINLLDVYTLTLPSFRVTCHRVGIRTLFVWASSSAVPGVLTEFRTRTPMSILSRKMAMTVIVKLHSLHFMENILAHDTA